MSNVYTHHPTGLNIFCNRLQMKVRHGHIFERQLHQSPGNGGVVSFKLQRAPRMPTGRLRMIGCESCVRALTFMLTFVTI
jgi:hypothetical protein